jgi:hypothetical protein
VSNTLEFILIEFPNNVFLIVDKKIRLFFLIILLLLSSCVKDIWNESGKRDPITGEWEKWCPPIKRNIDGSCREKL